MIVSENRTPLFGIMRPGSEPERTSSGAWLRNRLYGWICICLPKHDRAEGRSHRRFRRDAMVLGGVVRRVVRHHSGAKRVARTDFFYLSPPRGERSDCEAIGVRGPIRDSEPSGNAPSPHPLPARGERVSRVCKKEKSLTVAQTSLPAPLPPRKRAVPPPRCRGGGMKLQARIASLRRGARHAVRRGGAGEVEIVILDGLETPR